MPAGLVKGSQACRGRKPALGGCMLTGCLPQRKLGSVTAAAVKGLTVQPQDWPRCQLPFSVAAAAVKGLAVQPQDWPRYQLPFSLCLCSLGPLLVALVMWSRVQALLEFCEFL